MAKYVWLLQCFVDLNMLLCISYEGTHSIVVNVKELNLSLYYNDRNPLI